MMGTTTNQAKKDEMTGAQVMLEALDGMIATSQRLSKLCDDFIEGQPEREKTYLGLIDLVASEPKEVALRPDVEASMDALLHRKLRQVRSELANK